MTIRDQVSKRLYETLYARGQMPWRKADGNEGQPTNVLTKRAYSGVNALLLQASANKHGFTSKWWGTFEQWCTLDGWVPNDAKATEIVLYKPKNGGRIEYALSRWVAYNLDQIERVDHLRSVIKEEVAPVDWLPAEKLIANSGAKINFVLGTYAAYNRPPVDNIIFPLKRQFEGGPGGLRGYYDSLFHELMHWTEPRLLWYPDKKWDEPTNYAINELRAEIGAGLTATAMGLPSSKMERNHLNYLDRWLYAMKKDPGLIFKVAMAACVGSDYLLAFVGKKEERHNLVPVEAA